MDQKPTTLHTVCLPDPGLVVNAPDHMSCFPACIQMAMRTHAGGPVYAFDQIDALSHRETGLYSWEYGVLADLAAHGYQIKRFNLFDVQAFVNKGADYLIEFYGPDVEQDQVHHTNIPATIETARAFLAQKNISQHPTSPEIQDIWQGIDAGYYAIIAIDQCRYLNKPGTDSHVIFAYGYNARGIVFHNPGPPPQRASEMSWEQLIRCWDRPSKEQREMYLIQAPLIA